MMKIIIKTTNNQLFEYVTDEILTKIEMPYGCIGYGFNGSSFANIEDLEKYWRIVDKILDINQLTKEEYLTLIEISDLE